MPDRETLKNTFLVLLALALVVLHNTTAAPTWLRSTYVTQHLKIEALERRIARLEMIARHTGYDWEAPDEDKAKDVFIFSEPPAYNPPK